MARRPQHARAYRPVPPLLRQLREEAGMTQRALGAKLKRPQSWIQNCETSDRRVDVAEFVLWCRACGVQPGEALRQLLAEMP